ncbi:MAG: Mut7-C RNAse domain-containing protein [Telluria sp.]
MVKATFRFYGELNDFIAPARRQRDFETPCARAATTKHMIEALGVPHTEVELVLLNGEPAGLDRLIEDGDRIAAYPAFSSLNTGPQPTGELRFVADAHLGALARFLRMAGFDTLYDNNYMDGEIEQVAMAEGRTVLTRDRELLKRRGIARGCYVHAIDAMGQFREIVQRLGLAGGMKPFTLCLKCNAPLRAAGKAEVTDRLPPSVREHHTGFSVCDTCHGVFWKGSHWRRMCAALEQSARAPVSRS